MLRRRKPAVNHVAQSRLSWPSAVRVVSVVSVEQCSISATNPCRLAGWRRGDLARAEKRPAISGDPQRSSVANPWMERAPSQLPSNLGGTTVTTPSTYIYSWRGSSYQCQLDLRITALDKQLPPGTTPGRAKGIPYRGRRYPRPIGCAG